MGAPDLWQEGELGGGHTTPKEVHTYVKVIPTWARGGNGAKILHPTKAEIYVEDNGDYYLDIEAPLIDL